MEAQHEVQTSEQLEQLVEIEQQLKEQAEQEQYEKHALEQQLLYEQQKREQEAARHYPPTKPVCQLDSDNLYICQTEADLDPLSTDGTYLLPAGCVDTRPPEVREGYACRWNFQSSTWEYLEDHRGQTAYNKTDGAGVIIEQVGGLPESLTFVSRTSELQTWDSKANEWVFPPEVKAKIKEEQQAAAWEAIKQKRYNNLRQGVFVKSVGKWFQTDDATRLQYLTLRTLPDAAFPLKEPWKTMDNTYLPKEKCSRALFDEIVMQMVADETADFHNAERHRLAMLRVDEPLKYDFSDGWTANFSSTLPQPEEPKAE